MISHEDLIDGINLFLRGKKINPSKRRLIYLRELGVWPTPHHSERMPNRQWMHYYENTTTEDIIANIVRYCLDR